MCRAVSSPPLPPVTAWFDALLNTAVISFFKIIFRYQQDFEINSSVTVLRLFHLPHNFDLLTLRRV